MPKSTNCAQKIPVPRRRGNSNWRRPIMPATVLITESERQVSRLRLTAKMYIPSADLHAGKKIMTVGE